MDKIENSNNKTGLSRRNFLALLGVVTLEATDQTLFKGVITKSLIRSTIDNEYREKLLETVANGRATQKLKDTFYDSITPYTPETGLGKKENLTEENLEKGFTSYEIRPLTESGQETRQLVLVASYKNNIEVLITELDKDIRNSKLINLFNTQEEFGPFYTVPSSNIGRGPDGDIQFSFYSQYKTSDGIKTYSEDTLKYCSGAAVVTNNNELVIVDRGEILNYKVGVNCLAIQSYPFAINSEDLEEDLKSVENAQYRFNDNYDLKSRRFNCFLATFTASNGLKETVVISVYQHCSDTNKADAGDYWQNGMSVEHGVNICEQLMKERRYEKYVMTMPDPNYLHSQMNGPIIPNDEIQEKHRFRTFGKNTDPVIEESEFKPFGFVAPIILAAKLQ